MNGQEPEWNNMSLYALIWGGEKKFNLVDRVCLLVGFPSH